MNCEKRTYHFSTARAAADGRTVDGYALKFGTYSEDLGGFVETIARDALDGVLEKSDVRAVVNHDSNRLLARQSAGTLRLKVDDIGLHYAFESPETTAGNDLVISVRRRDMKESSFSFTIEEDEWVETEDRGTVRIIKRFRELYDVSPVTFPAYKATEVTMHALAEHRNSISDSGTVAPPSATATQGDPSLFRYKLKLLNRWCTHGGLIWAGRK